jgi:calcineurin-like phosphoesterase family protein
MGRLARFEDRLDQLHGEIHLIAGNHDACSPIHRQAHKHQAEWLRRRFASIQAYARRRIRGANVLLSHYPYRGAGDHTAEERYSQYRLVDEGLWLLHGHIHSAQKRRRRQIHVGLDAWDLSPVSIDTIAELIAAEETAE